MKRFCPCFTPSRIALAESFRETVSLPRLAMLSTHFFSLEQETFLIFTLHDLTDFYVERTTALGPGAIRSLHILHIWRNATCRLFLMPLFKFTGLCLWYLSYFRIDQTI